MPDYDFRRLGSRAFEQMIVSLGRLELGPGLSVFGDGKDGGREATFDGTIRWSATFVDSASTDQWTGHTVVQAKYRLKPAAEPYENAVWLQGEIRDEIGRWAKAAEKQTRERLPDYLIFVTNFDLSAVAKTGGIDKINKLVSGLIGVDSDAFKAGLHVRGVKLWHADQIRAMLDAHQDVRWAFDGLLTVGDVLAALGREHPRLGTLDVDDPLRQAMVAGLTADRWVRLSESGGAGDAKLLLDDIVVDVPVSADGDAEDVGRALQTVLGHGDTVLRPQQPDRTGHPGLVLIGGPGQGKSTLSQMIVQAYRASILNDAVLAPASRNVVTRTAAALRRLGLALPGNRRWPVRVDLARYAEHLSTGADTSLLRWIANITTAGADVEVTPAQLSRWQRAYPWAVVLDGLDEVPSLRSRELVYSKIEEFVTKAEDGDCDLLVVVSTRPSGYDERLPEEFFRHLRLGRLSPADAADFAALVTATRFVDDPAMRTEVEERMRAAALDPRTARLLETPLQVTIMSVIVQKYPTLPSDRFTLFNLYFETVFDREVAKNIAVSRFLSEYRQPIERLHERVGLQLHVQAEQAAGAESVLPPHELGALAAAYLQQRGYEVEQAEGIAERVVQAALHRLVLLVPREDGLGFEIRTLQEVMAARALTQGSDEQVEHRLTVTALSPHWQNTWVLAAGSLLASSERFEALLVRVLHSLQDQFSGLGRRLVTAPRLAAELLLDGLATTRPAFARALVTTVTGALEQPVIAGRARLAECLDDAMQQGFRGAVQAAFDAAAAQGVDRRAATAVLLGEMAIVAPNPARTQLHAARRDNLRLSAAEQAAVESFTGERRAVRDEPEFGPAQRVADAMAETASASELGEGQQEVLRAGLDSVDADFQIFEPGGVAVLSHARYPHSPALEALVEDAELAWVLGVGLTALEPARWVVAGVVAASVHTAISRRAVGGQLLASVQQPE